MAITDRYKSLADLPERVPVFPLLGAILLPRAALPLNIFEDRYLAMVNHVLRGPRLITIVQPSGEAGPTGSPTEPASPLKAIGCVGRITAFQELDDGRYRITLTGVCRASLGPESVSSNPFRTFALGYTAFVDDLVPGKGNDGVDRERLLGVLKEYLEARRLTANWPILQKLPNEQLVNSLAIASPFNPTERQALLEAHDLARRAEILISLALMEIAERGGGSGSAPGNPGTTLQ